MSTWWIMSLLRHQQPCNSLSAVCKRPARSCKLTEYLWEPSKIYSIRMHGNTHMYVCKQESNYTESSDVEGSVEISMKSSVLL